MNYEQTSEILKALGHPVRLRIVEGLLKNECNVSRIMEVLNIPQSTASQHLGILRVRGIIVPRNEGKRRCYKVVDKNVKKIINLFKGE